MADAVDEDFEFAVGPHHQSSLSSECSCFTSFCCMCANKVGNMVVLSERVEIVHESIVRRSIRCVVGPYWPVMVFVTYPLFIGVSALVAVFVLPKTHFAFMVVFFVALIVTLVSLGLTACTDPGILPRHKQQPAAGQGWYFSDQASTFRPKGAVYCSDCNCIIEEFDHTCPWTGTGIGKNNLSYFHCFTGSCCFLVCLVIFLCAMVFVF